MVDDLVLVKEAMVSTTHVNRAAWMDKLRSTKNADELTAVLRQLPMPELRYDPSTDIQLSALQELEIRFCAREIVRLKKLEELSWDDAWSGVFPVAANAGEVTEMVQLLINEAIIRLRTGKGCEDCETLEEHLRMMWLEDCVTLNPFLKEADHA